MKPNTLTIALASALIGAGSMASIQTIAQHDQHKGHTMQANSASMQIHKIMAKPMAHKPTGDIDRDFAAMMAAHHMDGIRASQIELKHGKVAELKQLAQKMVAEQTKERKVLLKHAGMKH